MCGSNPLPDAVTRSTGMGAPFSGSDAFSASTRLWTAFIRASIVGPRLDPDDAAALYGNGAVAEGRLQKYLGSSNGCPIKDEPTTRPSLTIKLPLAWYGNSSCARAVIPSGYTSPVRSVRSNSNMMAGLICARIDSSQVKP